MPDPRRWVALALVALAALAAFAFRDRIAVDFWPLDRSSVGPNLLASVVQAVAVLIVLVLLWPPVRRRIHAFTDRKLAPLHTDVEALHERHDAHDGHAEALRESIEQLRASVSALHAEHRKLRERIEGLG